MPVCFVIVQITNRFVGPSRRLQFSFTLFYNFSSLFEVTHLSHVSTSSWNARGNANRKMWQFPPLTAVSTGTTFSDLSPEGGLSYHIVTCYSDYRRVLDWQLRLLDHSVHFTIHYSAYTLQLTTTESLLFLWRLLLQLCNHCCNQLLWHPLPSLVITDSELSHHGCRRPNSIAREQTTKKTPSPIPVLLYDVITGTGPKENNSSFHCCVA
jgi:hypothetical protein